MSTMPFTTIRTFFNRHHLLFARLGWLLVLLLVWSLLIANLPYQVVEVQFAWQVGEAWPFARNLFETREGFARWLIFWRLGAGLVFFATAVLLAWRKWRDAVVLLFSADLLLLGIFYSLNFDIGRIRFPRLLIALIPSLDGISLMLIAGALLSLFYLFPDGRFQPRRHRWLAWLAVINALAWTALFSFDSISRWLDAQWPVLRQGNEELGWTLFVGSLFVALLVGLMGQVYRYRRVATAEQRQQTKWAVVGLFSLLISPIGSSLLFALFDISNTPLSHFLSLHLELLIVLVPITIAFSMLRYRLWEVDVWINRAVVYGGLTTLIIIAYVLVVGILSRAFTSRDTDFASFLALLMIMLLIVPLHRWLQTRFSHWLPSPTSPSPTPAAPPMAPAFPGLRLFQIGWLLLFVLLLWQAVTGVADWAQLVQVTQREWIVQSGYQLLQRWVSVRGYTIYLILLDLAISLIFVGLATFIFWKRRQDGLALYVATTLLLFPFGVGTGPTASSEGLSAIGILMLVVLFFIFPDGRFIPQTGRNRGLLFLGIIVTPFVIFALLRLGNQSADAEWLGYVTMMLTIGMVMVAGVGSQVSRYRHEADPVRRQQTKWVLYGFGLQLVWIGWFAIWFLLQEWLSLEDPFFSLVMIHLVMVMPLALALTLALSILRYGLWEIEVLVQRTAVYGTLTTLVLLAYIGLVGGLGELLRGESVWLTVITTGLVALAIQPLRQRLQTAVNRLMYGERDDPITVLTALGKQLAETAVPTDTLPALVETIAQTLKLPYVAIVGAGEILVEYNLLLATRHSLLATFPLIYQSETIGQLLVAPRAPHESFNPAEMRLLENVARQAGTAVYAAQLTHDLQRSRERLVTTREEERRRLRRDLHDGLGPQMATLTIKVGAAQNLLRTDPDGANDLLDQVKAESQKAIKEIRRVVNDLRPSVLDQLGLLSALHEFVTQNQAGSTQITLHTPDGLPPLPAAVEVAAYRIVTEAITNTIRHAQARICTIHLEIDESVTLKIDDDGSGLAEDFLIGVGLASMRERAVEIGGSFEIQSKPGQGTRIAVRLPITGDK